MGTTPGSTGPSRVIPDAPATPGGLALNIKPPEAPAEKLPVDPKNPGVAITDPNAATAMTAAPPPPTKLQTAANDGTEAEADPNNAEKKDDKDSKEEDKLGPTWFDALLLAMRSGVKLSQALADKGFEKGTDLYKQHQAANQQRLLKDLDKLNKLATALQATYKKDPNNVDPILAENLEKTASKIANGLNNIENEGSKLAAKQIRDELAKVQPKLTASKSSLSATPKPSPSGSPSKETPEQEKVRKANEAAVIKKAATEKLSRIQPTTPAGQPSVFQPFIDRANAAFKTLKDFHTNPTNPAGTPGFASKTSPAVIPQQTAAKSRVTQTPTLNTVNTDASAINPQTPGAVAAKNPTLTAPKGPSRINPNAPTPSSPRPPSPRL